MSSEFIIRTQRKRLRRSGVALFFLVAGCFLSGPGCEHSDATVFPELEDMVFVPVDDERPERAFFVDRFEVTNREFREFVELSAYRPSASAGFLRHLNDLSDPSLLDDYPVVWVNRDDAVAFAKWKRKRIPTEVEWVYAANLEDKARYPFGSTFHRLYANVLETGIGESTPVGMFESGLSRFGCYDLLGNIWEWTDTKWATSQFTKSPFDPIDRSNEVRGDDFVIRGGSFKNRGRGDPPRRREVPYDRGDHLGFRCVMDAMGLLTSALSRLTDKGPEAYDELLEFEGLADLAGSIDSRKRIQWEFPIPSGTELVGLRGKDRVGPGFLVLSGPGRDKPVSDKDQENEEYSDRSEFRRITRILCGLDGVTGRLLYSHEIEEKVLSLLGLRAGEFHLGEIAWVEGEVPKVTVSWDLRIENPLTSTFGELNELDDQGGAKTGFIVFDARSGALEVFHVMDGSGARVRSIESNEGPLWLAMAHRVLGADQFRMVVPENARRTVSSAIRGVSSIESGSRWKKTRVRFSDEKEGWRVDFPLPITDLGKSWPGDASFIETTGGDDRSFALSLGDRGVSAISSWVEVIVYDQSRKSVRGRTCLEDWLGDAPTELVGSKASWSLRAPDSGPMWRVAIDHSGKPSLIPESISESALPITGIRRGDTEYWAHGPDQNRRATLMKKTRDGNEVLWDSDEDQTFGGRFSPAAHFELAFMGEDQDKVFLCDESGEFLIFDLDGRCLFRLGSRRESLAPNRVSLVHGRPISFFARPKWITMFDLQNFEAIRRFWIGPWAQVQHGSADFDGDGQVELVAVPLSRSRFHLGDEDSTEDESQSERFALISFGTGPDSSTLGKLLDGFRSREELAK